MAYFTCETGRRNGNQYAIYWDFAASKIEEREYPIGVTIPEYNWVPTSGQTYDSIPPADYVPEMMAMTSEEGETLVVAPVVEPVAAKTTTTKTAAKTTTAANPVAVEPIVI